MDSSPRWTRALLMAKATDRLLAENIGDARRNVEWILCELLKCNRASLYAHPESLVDHTLADQFWRMLDRRLLHEPLQYIVGYTEFCGLRFDVSPDVLIPRPETELLVEHATKILKTIGKPAVLDIGSGSGCIPVSIKHFNPHALVCSCDVSDAALAMASSNAGRLNKAVTFFQCNILDETIPLNTTLKFDLIVSNPPYIPTEEYRQLDKEVLNFEPGLALDSGEDPLQFYRAISTVAINRLHEKGALLFETHCDFAHDVASLLTSKGFHYATVLQDLTNRDRFVLAKKG